MKVYNQDKTNLIDNPNLDLGYLKEDKLTINHPKVEEVKEQGHYEVIKKYPNGGEDIKWIVDVQGVEGQEARTEVKDILIYIPYTQVELENKEKEKLRSKREVFLLAFDKYRSAVGYGLITETKAERDEIIKWYNNLLNLDSVTINNDVVPTKVSYYL